MTKDEALEFLIAEATFGSEDNITYWDQPTIVYHARPPFKDYKTGYSDLTQFRIGICGANTVSMAHQHKAYKARHGWMTAMDIVALYPNRFEALCKEFELRPEPNMGWNVNPGGIEGIHFTGE